MNHVVEAFGRALGFGLFGIAVAWLIIIIVLEASDWILRHIDDE